jgi:hypothetical protein
MATARWQRRPSGAGFEAMTERQPGSAEEIPMTSHRDPHDDRPYIRPDGGHGRRWSPVGTDEPIEHRRRRAASDAVRGLVDLAVGGRLASRPAPA